MPAIDSVMKKLGFVRLSRFGLVLTPEGRVISMRPAVLDDGFGGRIVGWQDGDLAAAELEKWEAARPAGPQAVASRVAAPTPPPLPPRMPAMTRPMPIVPAGQAAPIAIVREHAQAMPAAPVMVAVPPIAAASAPMVAAPAPRSVAVPPRVAAPTFVAAEPVVEEDDWEWTIAIARARAAAEEVALSVEAPRASAPARRTRSNTVPPSVEHSRPREQPQLKPIAASVIDYNDYTSPTTEVVRVARAQPTTVIPIPRMPTAANTSPRSSSMGPVVRPTLATAPTPIVPSSPRRFAKGTGPIMPKSASSLRPPVLPMMHQSDDTVPNISLPPAAAAVALPSIKRA